MATIARVVHFQLSSSANVGDTIDLVDADLTTIDGGLVFLSGGTGANLARTNDSRISIGGFSATNELVSSNISQFGQGTSRCARRQDHTHCVQQFLTSTGLDCRLFVNSFIPGGVRLEYESVPSQDWHGQALLFEGCAELVLDEVELDAGSLTGMGGYPDFVAVWSTTTNGSSTSIITNGRMQFGVGTRDPATNQTQHRWGNGWNLDNGESSTLTEGGIADDWIGLRVTGYYERYDIFSWNPDGVTFLNVAQKLGNARVFAVRLADGQRALCGTQQWATGLGADSIPIDYTTGSNNTEAALFFGFDQPSQHPVSEAPFNSFFFGAVDAKLNQAASTIAEDYGNGTTQSASAFSNAHAAHLVQTSATPVVKKTAAVTSVTGGSIDFDITANNGSADWFGWLAIQGVDAPAAGAKIRRVVYQLAAGQSSGTFDITHPDITTPDCWLVFISGSTAVDGSRQPHAQVSVGAGTLTSTLTALNYAKNNVGTTHTRRKQGVAHEVVNAGVGTFVEGAFSLDSVISGGLRFQYTQSFVQALQVVVYLIEGCEEVSLEDNTNLNGGTYSGMAGYPDMLFVYGTTGGDTLGSPAKASIGFATRDPSDNSINNQWALGWDNQDSASNVVFGGGVLDDYILGRSSSPSLWFERYSLASFNLNGYTFTGGKASLTGARILAIRFPADQQVLSGIRPFATGLGADSIPTVYQSGSQDSDFAFIAASSLVGLATSSPSVIQALTFGGADRNLGQASVSFIDQHGIGTAQSESQFDSSNIINYAQGGTGTVFKTTAVTSLDGGQITLDHSVNNGEAAWYGWFTLQAGAVGPPPTEPADIDLPAAAATARADAPTITAPQPVDIDLPIASATARADAPTITAPQPVDIDLPAASPTAKADVPAVDAPSDKTIDLPAAAATGRADAPVVDAPRSAGIDLPAVAATARADAPTIDIPSGADVALPAASATARADAPSVDAPQPVDVNLPAVAATGRADAPAVDAPRSADIALPAVATTAKADVPAVDAPTSKTINLPAGSATATAPAPTTDYPLLRRTPILGIPKNPRNELFVDPDNLSRPDHTIYLYNETALPVESFEDAGVTWADGNTGGPNPGGTATGPKWVADPRGEGPELWFDNDVNRISQILGLAGQTRPYTLLTIVYNPNIADAGDRGVHVFGDGGTPDDDYVGHWQRRGEPTKPFRGYGEIQSAGVGRDFLGTDQDDWIDGDYTVLAVSNEDDTSVQTYSAHLPTDSAFALTGNMADRAGVPPIPNFPLNRWWIGGGRADVGNGTPLFLQGYAIGFMVWKNRALAKAELDAFLAGGLFQHIVAEAEVTPGADIYLPQVKATAKADAPSIEADENSFSNLPAVAATARADAPTIDADTGINVDLPVASATARASNPLTSAIIVDTVNLPAVATTARADAPTTTIPDPPVFQCPAKQPGYVISINEQDWYNPNLSNYQDLVNGPNFFNSRLAWSIGYPNFTVLELDFRWRYLEHQKDNYTGLHDMLDHALAWRDARLSDPTPMTLNLAFYAGTDRWGADDGQSSYGPSYIDDNPQIYYGDDRGGTLEQSGGVYRRTDNASGRGKLTIPWDGTAPNHPGYPPTFDPVTNRDRSPWRDRFSSVLVEAYKWLKFRGRENLLEYVIISSETAKGAATLRKLDSYSPQNYKDAIIDEVSRTRAKLDAEGGTHVGVLMGCNYFMSGIDKGQWANDLLDPIRDAGGGIGLQDPKIVYGGDTDKLEITQWMRENNGVAPCWMEGDQFFLTTQIDPVTNQPLEATRYTKSANGTLEDEYPAYLNENGYPAGGWFPHYMRWIWSVGPSVDPTGTAGQRWLDAVANVPLVQQLQCGQYPIADISPPGISPSDGVYPLPLQVTITEDPQADATYYIIGATAATPTPSDTLYTGPFQVTGTSVVSARSIKDTLWTTTITRSYTEQGTTGGRSARLRIPQDARGLLALNFNAVNRPLATFYWAGGPTGAQVASFEDESYQLQTGAGTDTGEPELQSNPNGEGPEVYFFATQESLFLNLGQIIAQRPVTFLCIERFSDGLSFPNSQRAAWAAGDGDLNKDGTRGDGDFFSIWKDDGGTNNFGAYGEQESQGESRGFWNAVRFPLDPSKYRYQVISYASGTDCKAYMANDDDVAFRPLGNMTDGFIAPLTDWTFFDVWLGGGRVDADSPIPVWGGHIIGFMVWDQALTESELNDLLNQPNKFFNHIVSATGANIDMPAVAATAAAANPAVTVETDTTIDIPAVAATAKADAPTITTSTTEDAFINLPAALAVAAARTPTVSGPIPIEIDLPAQSAAARATAPTVSSGQPADIDLPAASATARADGPTVTAELQPADIDLPAASAAAQASPLAITTVGADVALGAASAVAQARTVIITTTDALAQPFPYEFFQPGDRSRYGIQVPTENIQSLQRSAMQAKEAIEALLGYRGSLYEGLNFGGDSTTSEPQDFSQLLEYLQTVEERLVEYDGRITGNQDVNDVQDGRLDGIDVEQITQNTRLDALEAGGGEDLEPRVEALETNDAVQDGRLDGIDAEQVTQNSRIFQNEQDIALLQTAAQFLLDGTYAFGRRTSRLRWSPANSGSNPNTRISFDEVTLLSNVQHPDNFSFTPDYEADYFVNVNLRFAPDSSGDEWYIQTYVNGSGAGSPFYFKPDEVSGGEQVLMSTQFGFHMVPGDVLDIRLWPDDSGKAGWIEAFNYSMIGMGLDGIPVSS